MTSPLAHSLWQFFLQGFHFWTHPIQTIITILALGGIAGTIISAAHTLYQRAKAAFILVRDDAGITKDEWFEHKRQLGEAVTNAKAAKAEADVAKSLATAAQVEATAAKAQASSATSSIQQHAGTHVGFESRLSQIDGRVQAVETTATSQVAPVIPGLGELRLELDNHIDEIREEIRLFKEETDGRVTALEFETEENAAGDAVLEQGLSEIAQVFAEPVKPKRGRPIGSKNKKKKGPKGRTR